MTSANVWDFFTPHPPLSEFYVLFFRQFGVFFNPPPLCTDVIHGSPLGYLRFPALPARKSKPFRFPARPERKSNWRQRQIVLLSKYTVLVLRMAQSKWRESKQQPSMLPGCYLVSFHILWVILSTSTGACYIK